MSDEVSTLTQYSTLVQLSIVIHWNTVSMAKPKLSKWVMPQLGPGHPDRHSVPLMVQRRPFPAWAQGDATSFSLKAIMSVTQDNMSKWLILILSNKWSLLLLLLLGQD